MTVVAVTGANGPLGQRGCALALADADVTKLVRTDTIPGAGLNDAEAAGELKRLLDGVDTLVHLGASLGPELDGTGSAGFAFHHADGTPYGGVVSLSAVDVVRRVVGMLEHLGFKATRARALVEKAAGEVTTHDAAALLHAALRAT